jgi:hypothetical protein
MRTTVLTYDDIMALRPCYDPAEVGYCTHEWRGTALDDLPYAHCEDCRLAIHAGFDRDYVFGW